MLSIMLSQFNVCIDDLNPARREVIRIMWHCICEHTVNIYQQPMNNSENLQDARLRRNRLILTAKGWPRGGDQGPVLGLGPFGSVPLQRSVNYRTVNIMFTNVVG